MSNLWKTWLPQFFWKLLIWHWLELVTRFSGLGGKSVRFLNGKWKKITHLNLVRGTLLFGEFVKEICTYHPGYEGFETRYSLHVIDAIRLGDMDLRHYTYLERCLPSTSQPLTDFDSFQV